MTDRLDAVVAREYTDRDGNKKTQWTKIGSAWATKSGGWSITLEALPLPSMGERGLETRIILMVPKARDDHQRQPARQQEQSMYGSGPADFDDEIPF